MCIVVSTKNWSELYSGQLLLIIAFNKLFNKSLLKIIGCLSIKYMIAYYAIFKFLSITDRYIDLLLLNVQQYISFLRDN